MKVWVAVSELSLHCCGKSPSIPQQQAVYKLRDEINKLPEIFCEDVDLVLFPSLVADSCTELVQCNSSVLEAIKHKLESLSIDF